jgi:hypothetical protein
VKARGISGASIVLRHYLTKKHRDDGVEGCPLPAVMSDIARDGVGRHTLADEIAELARALQVHQLSSKVLRACRRFGDAAVHQLERNRAQ